MVKGFDIGEGWAHDMYRQSKTGPLTQYGPTYVAYYRDPANPGPPEVFDVEAFVGFGGDNQVHAGLALLRPFCSNANLVLQGGNLHFTDDHLHWCKQDTDTLNYVASQIKDHMWSKYQAYPITSGIGGRQDAANHWAGGCSLGQCSDPATMIVHGTTNVAVADSSVFPSSIWAHPSFTCAVVAHKAADLLASRLKQGDVDAAIDAEVIV